MGRRGWWGAGIYDMETNKIDYAKRTADLKWTIPEKNQHMMISIVMPVFNTNETYIREAVASIVGQTYKNFELIIVDDGSAEKTKNVLKSLYDSRIKLIMLSKNRGIGNALNIGFSKATGGYQTWWASDNIMEPFCLERLAFMLTGMPRVGFVYGLFSKLYMATGKKETVSLDYMKFDKNNLLDCYNLGICWLWRKEILDQAGAWSIEEWEDWDMFLRMSEITDFRFYYISPLGTFRDHADSNTNRLRKDNRWREIKEVPKRILKARIREPKEEKASRSKVMEVECLVEALQ